MALFSKKNSPALSPRMKLESQYNSASYNLYLIVIFSVINLILVLIGSNTYFLFSATIPYYITAMAMALCGKLPDEYYDPMYEYEFYDDSFLTVAVAIAIVLIISYLLCAIFSRKHRVGWIIAATVLFALDTIAMFLAYGIALDMLLDYLFHAWVLYYLIAGMVAHYKLKSLPEEIEVPVTENEFADEFKVNEDTFNSGFDYSNEDKKDNE